MDSAKLIPLLEKIPGKRILVIGDVMLDEYIFGTTDRISQEAPVPIVDVKFRHDRLGAAANVAENLKVLGCDVTLIGVVGNDNAGKRLRKLLLDAGVSDEFLIVDGRPTTTKTRLMSHNQQIARIDAESRDEISQDIELEVLKIAESKMASADCVVVSDYAKGFMTGNAAQSLVYLSSKYGKPIVVDPKRDLRDYAGATVLTPNQGELKAYGGTTADDVDGVKALLQKLNVSAILAKRSERGLRLFTLKDVTDIPAVKGPSEIVDISGAGDKVVVFFAAAVAAGISFESAARIASCAAGVKCRKLGNAMVSLDEVVNEFKRLNNEGRKVRSLDDLERIVQDLRSRGKQVVTTNGVFDILHRGHIEFLRKAKSFGDVLVVGVNTDRSVKMLKGEGRPINPLEERMAVMEGLDIVDYLFSFDEMRPMGWLARIKPHVHVKGGDYDVKTLPEREVVESNGGRIEIIPLLGGLSTTSLIGKVRGG